MVRFTTEFEPRPSSSCSIDQQFPRKEQTSPLHVAAHFEKMKKTDEWAPEVSNAYLRCAFGFGPAVALNFFTSTRIYQPPPLAGGGVEEEGMIATCQLWDDVFATFRQGYGMGE